MQPRNYRATPLRLSSRDCRRGYTLLELLLSLALSVLVIGVIGFGIQLYLVALTQQQAKIERKQLARGLIQMISNDLRAGVQYKATDYADLENLVQTQLLGATEAVGELAELAELAGEGAAEANALLTDVEEETTELVIDEEAESFRPALFGSSDAIALDVSRLPRMDQYNSIVADNESEIQTPSDIKTLSYFFSSANPRDNNGVQFAQVASGGLYRRQVDRAVASYAGDFGLAGSPDESSDLVAGEVAEIRFRYFDGNGWQSEWDSEELGGFPLAIEVTLVIDPTRSTLGQDYLYSGFNSAIMESYRTVIHLPAAELPPEEEE